MKGYKVIKIPTFANGSGCLSVLEQEKDITPVFEGSAELKQAAGGFDLKRVFYIYNVREGEVRGEHANRDSRFIMFAAAGSCEVLIDNGAERESVVLGAPDKALFIDRMTWKEMRNFSKDCVLVVLADTPYNEAEYIRDYGEFVKEAAN